MKYYSTANAAKELGYTKATLHNWCNKIPNLCTVNKPGIRVFTEEDLSFIRMVRGRLQDGTESGLLAALAYAASLKKPGDARPHYTVSEVASRLGYKTKEAIFKWIREGHVHPVFGTSTTCFIFDAAGLAECVEYNNRWAEEVRARRSEATRNMWAERLVSVRDIEITISGEPMIVSRDAAKNIVAEIMRQL